MKRSNNDLVIALVTQAMTGTVANVESVLTNYISVTHGNVIVALGDIGCAVFSENSLVIVGLCLYTYHTF